MRSACKKLEESNEKYGHGNNILFFNFKIIFKKLPKIKYVITRSFLSYMHEILNVSTIFYSVQLILMLFGCSYVI